MSFDSPNDTCFRYRSAPLASHVQYRVTQDALIKQDESGATIDKVSLKDLATAYYSSRQFKQIRMEYLELVSSDGKQHRISLNSPDLEEHINSDRESYLRLLLTLLSAIQNAQVSLQVYIGENSRWRFAWFLLGLSTLLTGIGITAAAVLSNVAIDRLIVVTPVMLLLSFIGYLITISNLPWKNPPAVTLDEFFSLLSDESNVQ